MDLQTYVMNVIATERTKTFNESDQLSLGEIISKCEEIAKRGYTLNGEEPTVCFDFEYARPVGIDSWRGIYAELALKFEFSGEEMPLSCFIDLLKDAVGKTFTGYKGGDFKMSRHTPVWVANYGNAGNTAVIGVVDNSYEVILMTGYREC